MTTTHKHQQGNAATFAAANSPPNCLIQLWPIPDPPQQQPEQLREQQGSNPPPRCLAIQPILQAATPTTLPAANKPRKIPSLPHSLHVMEGSCHLSMWSSILS